MHWNETDFHSTLLTHCESNHGLNGVLLYLNSLYTDSTMEILMLLFCFLVHLSPLFSFSSIAPLFFSFFFSPFHLWYEVDMTTDITSTFLQAECWGAASGISMQSQMCWNGFRQSHKCEGAQNEGVPGVSCGSFKLSKPNFYSVEVLLLLQFVNWS